MGGEERLGFKAPLKVRPDPDPVRPHRPQVLRTEARAPIFGKICQFIQIGDYRHSPSFVSTRVLVGVSSLGCGRGLFDRFGHGFLACGWIPGGLVVPICSVCAAMLLDFLRGLLQLLRILVCGDGSSCPQPNFCVI